jgi:DNA helicase HerA-like ATPase
MGEEMQRLVTWSILEHIHSHMLSQKATEGIKLIVVIDEGHKFVLGRVEEVPLAQHLREGRKFGTSYIIVSHLLDDLLQEADLAKKRGVPTIAALVSTTIVFGNGNPSEAYIAQRLLNLIDNERRRLEGFTTGEAFIKWSIDPRPLYFKIEPEKKALVKQRIGRREMYYEAL